MNCQFDITKMLLTGRLYEDKRLSKLCAALLTLLMMTDESM